MAERLYKELDTASKLGVLDEYKNIPLFVKDNLNPKFKLRAYQTEAFARFSYYIEKYPQKELPIHLLYNMATGSGKTLIMAGLIFYLYKKGYRNFLFFVNSTNVIEKTRDNFLNNLSSKYLFNQKTIVDNKHVKIIEVKNFEGINNNDINICFKTIQQLHSDLTEQKENSITFEDFKNKKIVLLSDEAHHIQVQTKQKELTEERESWENTVLKVFNQNTQNILLEFTATIDLKNEDIKNKYQNKIIYKYDLKEFRKDGYSKDIEFLRSDMDKKGRILLAIIFNQYKQDIASKNGITLKPVILFKAQKLIQQSRDNKILFHKIIEELSKKDIEEIKTKTNIPEIQKALQFYDKEGIDLVQKLKISFAENKCLSVNEDNEKENNQLLLNHLEDENNQIRAIFAVQKLNEGWDVLNLFDIVRLYKGGRGSKDNKTGKTTIAEVQLIGRGARYFPFNIKNNNDEEDKYKRKFDKDLNNELRILEELHFHALNEPKYISELNQALVEEGLKDPRTVKRELKLKDSFKQTDFYKSGSIYINEQKKNDYSDVISIEDLGVTKKAFLYPISSFKGKVTQAFSKDMDSVIQTTTKTYKLSQIEQHVIKNALANNDFFSFENIKRYFPKTKSMNDFITKNLEKIEITFSGTKDVIYNLSNAEIYKGVLTVLDDIKTKINSNLVDYKGSEIFNPKDISILFTDKTINIEEKDERANGDEDFLKDKEWYVFNANYGTSEEKNFVKFFNRFMEQLKTSHKEIYLLRNELFFKIYNFDDGRPFHPDFVLFLKTKSGNERAYQIFIEPKGEFLEEKDKWKEVFLEEIKDRFKVSGIKKFMETGHYMVIGLPFFESNKELEFKEELIKELS